MRAIISRCLGTGLLLIFGLSNAPAQIQKTRLEAMDVFNMEYASDPQVAPDGRRVIYVRQFADIMTDRRLSNLWIVSVDGKDHRPITTGHFNDSSPRWSADGSRVAFVSNREGSNQIYVLYMDTLQIGRVTNLQSSPSGLAWSPDGKYISFTSHVPERAPKIAEMPSPPQGARWADAPKVIDKLVYRFDQEGYKTPGFTHLFIVPAEGGMPRQISSGNYQHGGAGFRASDAVWTPDSKFLIMSANRRDDYEMEPLDSEIFEFSIADGSVRALTKRKGPDTAPAVSPDGKYVAYLGFDDRYQGYQITRLYVMNRDGSSPRVLTANLDRDAQRPRWALDGSGIYFNYDDQGNSKLAFTSLDGKMRTLTGNLGSGQTAASGGVFTVGRNGTVAFTYTRPNTPSDIAVVTASNPTARVLTSINEDLLSQRKLGEVEELWYESSKDGRRVHAWIIKPPDFNASKKYPLIIEIHGGPFANYGDRFDIEKQFFASKDYVVLYTNPRGSTSYGEEFGNLIHHAYPGDDFFDLNSGVDALIAKGYIDPNNLFVTGGSGGGVLTTWMIGRTDRFRAAAAAYPVINWYSFVLTADISSFVSKYWFPGFPWDHAAHYESRSLLSVVKNVKTPTLVITGEDDHRTPISESEQYYQALKLLGVETMMVRVPGEPHGIRRRPSHHAAKMLNIIGWFEKHRKK